MSAETVDTRTGEIVPVPDSTTLESLSPRDREVAVTAYLSTARDRLALALEATGPDAVARLKAEIATAAEATKQLSLSREIQLDAKEMVRRAEYALGKAIRKGQAEGTIRKTGETETFYNRWTGESALAGNSKRSPTDFATDSELNPGGDKAGIYDLADGVEPEQFERALTEAKDEGNLSRANVARKVRGEPLRSKASDRPELLRGTRRPNANRIVEETVIALEGLRIGLDLLDVDQLDLTHREHWLTSLRESMRHLRWLVKELENAR